jgi:hypothetical protein
MYFTHRSGAEQARKNRARAARKPKVRWEVLGLPNPATANPTSSMEDIRRQVSRMANSWLEEGPLMTQGRGEGENG